MKKVSKLIKISLCLFTLLTLFIIPVNAEEKKTVRIGFPQQERLTMKDENGGYSGYSYDYLKEIAKYAGWNLEIVEVEGDVNQQLMTCLEMLSNGEVDVMTGLAKNKTTLEKYDFSDESYGNIYNVIAAPINSTVINEYNITSLEKVRIALNKNAKIKNEQFFQSTKMLAINYEVVWCDDNAKVIETVKAGLADVYTTVDTDINKDFRSILKYSPTPFYFGVTKGNVDIVQDLDRAIANINQINPTLVNTLYNKYFEVSLTKLVLTDIEKKYIADSNTLRVLVKDNYAPIEYYNEDGKIDGISYQIMERIIKYTGLKVEYVYSENYDDYTQKIKNKEVDLVLCAEYDYDLTNQLFLSLTNPFLDDGAFLVLKSGLNILDLDTKTIAAVRKDQNRIEQKVGKDKIKYFDTLEQCLEAVDNGTCDYTYGSNYATSYYNTKNIYKNITLISQNGNMELKYSIGITNNSDIYLTTILNKSIQLINNYELDGIIYQSSQQVSEFSILKYIQDNLFVSILIFVAIVAVGIGLLLLYYQNQLRMKKQTEIEYKRYLSLTEITNEIIFEYDYLKDCLSLSNTEEQSFADKPIIENYTKYIKEKSTRANHMLYELLMQKQNADAEICNYLKDGQKCWYRIAMKVIYDDGEAIYAIGKATNIHEEKMERQRLVKESTIDSLTSVYNAVTCKRLITERLQEQGNYALCMMDLDSFKNVNDTYGHYIGDQVLIETAKIIKNTFNNSCTIGRVGGDEFLILIPNVISKEQVEERCRTLIRNIKNRKEELKHVPISTISIGIVLTKECDDFTELYKSADKALYKAKENGRDGYFTLE